MNKSAPTTIGDVASPELKKLVEESIAKAVQVILTKFVSSGGLVSPQEPSSKNGDSSSPSNQTDRQGDLAPFQSGVNDSSQQSKILSFFQSSSILKPRLSLSL